MRIFPAHIAREYVIPRLEMSCIPASTLLNNAGSTHQLPHIPNVCIPYSAAREQHLGPRRSSLDNRTNVYLYTALERPGMLI